MSDHKYDLDSDAELNYSLTSNGGGGVDPKNVPELQAHVSRAAIESSVHTSAQHRECSIVKREQLFADSRRPAGDAGPVQRNVSAGGQSNGGDGRSRRRSGAHDCRRYDAGGHGADIVGARAPFV